MLIQARQTTDAGPDTDLAMVALLLLSAAAENPALITRAEEREVQPETAHEEPPLASAA